MPWARLDDAIPFVRSDGTVNYRAYRQSAEWRVLRRAVMRRAGFMCERCRRDRVQEIHHLTYVRQKQGHANVIRLWRGAPS